MSVIGWLQRLFTFGRGVFSLFLCVFLCSVLLSLKPGERQTFHEVVISTFLYPVQAILSRVNTTVFVFQQNRELKEENTRLRAENDLLNQALRLFPRVRELERFRDSSGLKLKMAEISAEDPGRFASTWVINLGKEDSVDLNMPVLTSKGIVGKIAKCYRGHSLVQTLADPNFKVSVMCDRSRVKGILESWRVGRLIARFPLGSDVAPGDTLVTSGLGGVFPKGLLVGVVSDGNLESDEVLRGVGVKPFQDLHLLEEVFVLQRQASWVVGKE